MCHIWAVHSTTIGIAGGSVAVSTNNREQNRLPNRQSGQRHQQAIDTHSGTGRRRHPVLEGGQEILVERHCLVVTGGRCAGLRLEPFALDNRIDEFGISGRQFDAPNVEVPFLGDTRRCCGARVSSGVVSTGKSRTNVGAHSCVADGVLPEFLDQFPVPVAAITRNLDIQSVGDLPKAVQRAFPG